MVNKIQSSGYTALSGEETDPEKIETLEVKGQTIEILKRPIEPFEDIGKKYNYFTFYTDAHPYYIE